MRTFDFTTVLCFFFFFATVAQAVPLGIQARKAQDVYVPEILEPTSQSLWVSGAEATVSWDTSNAPKQISNGGRVILDDGAHWRDISGPFDLRLGSINVKVPDQLPTGQYRIILFGDSGNASDKFTVQGTTETMTADAPTSTPAE